jgi:pSer/pThr/pTyr-binding forkhead associated (FHA) protein
MAMPSSTVILKVARGQLTEQEYVFTGRGHCILGRAEDCDIQVPLDQAHADVSRHHCLFDLDPPDIRVRDLGSRNGTYVNGAKIGQRPPHQTEPPVSFQLRFARRRYPATEVRGRGARGLHGHLHRRGAGRPGGVPLAPGLSGIPLRTPPV